MLGCVMVVLGVVRTLCACLPLGPPFERMAPSPHCCIAVLPYYIVTVILKVLPVLVSVGSACITAFQVVNSGCAQGLCASIPTQPLLHDCTTCLAH